MGYLQHCGTAVCLLHIQGLVFRDPSADIHVYSVATGYGQPPCTWYDWTLSSQESMDANFKLPESIRHRLDIEKFCDKVTKALYTNRRDPVGLCSSQERSTLTSLLSRDLDDLETQLKPSNDCKGSN